MVSGRVVTPAQVNDHEQHHEQNHTHNYSRVEREMDLAHNKLLNLAFLGCLEPRLPRLRATRERPPICILKGLGLEVISFFVFFFVNVYCVVCV